MASRAARSGVRGPWSRRVEPMSIREIKPIEVAQLAPRLVDHMVHVRTASGSLRAARVPRFTRVQTDRFRVGVPHGSRILVNDDLSEWLWLDSAGNPDLVDVHVVNDPQRWVRALSEVLGPQAATCSIFPRGDSEGFFARVEQQEIQINLAADLQRISALPEADLPINKALGGDLSPESINTAGTKRANIHLRSMSGGELGEYLSSILHSWARHQVAVYPQTTVDHWIQVGSDDLEQRLHDGVATPGHEILAVCTESQMVGGVWTEIDGQCSTMQYLYIYGPHRGNGCSRAALIGLAERLRAEGVRRIQAFMVPGQRHIIEVCMSVGFKVTERVVRISSLESRSHGTHGQLGS